MCVAQALQAHVYPCAGCSAVASGVAAASTQYMPTPVLPTSAPIAQPEIAGRKYMFRLPPDCAYTGRPPLICDCRLYRPP